MCETLKLKVEQKTTKYEIVNVIFSEKKVTDEKIESSLNYKLLTQEEKHIVDDFCSKIDITDNTQVLQFGSYVQNEISKLSDSVSNSVKIKNVDIVGELLTDFVFKVKNFDAEVPETVNPKGLKAIFFNAQKQIEKMIVKYDEVVHNVDKIEKKLETQKIKMLKNITVLDTMYNKNLKYFEEISLFIIAGQKKLEELSNLILPELQKKAQETGNQADSEKANNMVNMINRFENKINDLKTTRIISIQIAPQIRLIQNNDSKLVEKIQTLLINTIPLWKNKTVIALGLDNSKESLEVHKSVIDTKSETLKKTKEIAEKSEKILVYVNAIKQGNNDIIDKLNNVLKIHENVNEKRIEAEKELNNIQKNLKDKLLDI